MPHMEREWLEALAYPLPEGLAQHKAAGELTALTEAIDAQLGGPIPEALRRRLLAEKALCAELPGAYPDTFDALLTRLSALIPGVTAEELRALERRGKLDGVRWDGQPHYSARQVDTLLKVNPALAKRAGRALPQRKPLLDTAIEAMKREGELRYRMALCYRAESGAQPSPNQRYRLYCPLPIPAAQQEISGPFAFSQEPARVAPEDALQRTALFDWNPAQPLEARYAYVQRVRYVDPFGPAPKGPIYADRPPCADDLAEQPPHLAFTPLLRALAREVIGGETDALCKARLIYDYVTTHVDYSFMRPYRLIENGAEYAAVNSRGDCGIQALLFIALCRLSGVPARWQSGLVASPEEVGSHDWAQFYAEPFGWLFADCSFGGSAYRAIAYDGPDAEVAKARWRFYFGNLDPYRAVFNRAYFARFDPPAQTPRDDPYDNQTGELDERPRPAWTQTTTLESCERLGGNA